MITTQETDQKYGYAFLLSSRLAEKGERKKVWLQLSSRPEYEGEWLKLCKRGESGRFEGIWYSDTHVSGEEWFTEEDMLGENIGELGILDCHIWG